MAYTTINKSSSFMNAKTYTANASNNAITGVGFKPDWIITKSRTSAYNPNVYNSISGVGKFFNGVTAAVEGSSTDKISSFDADGFTLKNGDNSNYNNNGTGVGWSWKAGTTSGIATNGSTTITPSYYSFNQASGFSIIKYTGNATSGAKIAHGLGATPKMIIVKSLTNAYEWAVYNAGLGATKYIELQSTAAASTSSIAWNNTEPDSVNFTVQANNRTNGSSTYIAYCFADVSGYSKFSTYKGNGNADGTFVYTGFAPTFVMVKKASGTGSWWLRDNKLAPYNVRSQVLVLNSNGTETNGVGQMDFLSNGFKLRDTTDASNGSGADYVYMAFGQSIVGTNNVPNNAR